MEQDKSENRWLKLEADNAKVALIGELARELIDLRAIHGYHYRLKVEAKP